MIGIDFGSTGLRVADLGEGGRVEVLCGVAEGWPGLLLEARPESPLGVAFPSLKGQLGLVSTVAFEGRQHAPEQLVTAAFQELKRRVEEKRGRQVEEAVITVPALYPAAQRSALRQAVLAAGFTAAHLLTDSLAAVLARSGDGQGSLTALVYGMGYSGFEVGLVRVARGRCRALGYEGGSSPAGCDLDRMLLESWLSFLEGQELPLDVASWEPATWLAVRARIQELKETLSSEQQAVFPRVLHPGAGEAAEIRVTRAALETAALPALRRTLEHAENLLAQAGLVPADLDQVLLAGGMTRMPVLQRTLAEALGREPVLLAEDALARGAACFAARLEDRPLAAAEQERAAEPRGETRLTDSAAVLRQAMTLSKAPAIDPDETLVLRIREPRDEAAGQRAGALERATRLLEEGRAEEASQALTALIAEAESLLAKAREAVAATPRPLARRLARRALTRARRRLTQGNYEEAVRESHLAWKEDPDDPETFEQMIDVHCEAAESSRHYEDALRWLGCAHGHDQGNSRVRELIAEQHFRHARQLGDRGQREQALTLLETCLAWNPEHAAAHELQGTLLQR